MENTHRNKRSAATQGLLPLEQENKGIAAAWIASRLQSQNQAAKRSFEAQLDQLLKRLVPPGSRQGDLRGCEEDVRQEAYAIFEKYARGNRALKDAATSEEAIDKEIFRCAVVAVRLAGLRMARASALFRKTLEDYKGEMAAVKGIEAASSALNPWQLAPEARRRLALHAIDNAVVIGIINTSDAQMLRDRIEKGLNASDYAQLTGVSRGAISQREKRAVEQVQKALEYTEFTFE